MSPSMYIHIHKMQKTANHQFFGAVFFGMLLPGTDGQKETGFGVMSVPVSPWKRVKEHDKTYTSIMLVILTKHTGNVYIRSYYQKV
jgi:hypothetical protein